MQSRPFRKLSRAIRLKRCKRREAIQSDRLELYSSRSPPIDELQDHVTIALAGPRMARRRSTTAASTWMRHWPPWRSTGQCALGQHRADGGIGGGRDGDPDHCGQVFAGLVDANWEQGRAGRFAKGSGIALRLEASWEPLPPSAAANPPCRPRKALSPRFGLSISWAGKRNFVGRDWRAISGAECGRTAGIRFADRESPH